MHAPLTHTRPLLQSASLLQPAVIGVLLMLLLTLYSQRLIIPKLAALRTEMGSVDSTPATDPKRTEFDKLHALSVRLESGVLLILKSSLDKGQDVTLFLEGREHMRPVKVHGKVVWCVPMARERVNLP